MPASPVSSRFLNLHAVQSAPVHSDPYDYTIASGALDSAAWATISRDFPAIKATGSFPLAALECGPAFSALCQELLSPEIRQIVAERFNLDLEAFPTMLTVRGQADSRSDGRIHTDSREKIITVLLYLNEEWTQPGGRLRVLRSKNLEDYAAEIPPLMGQLLMFRRCDHSWHGHHPCGGQRRSIQLNWVRSDKYQKRESFRHKLSSLLKR